MGDQGKGADWAEGQRFLDRHPDVQAIDIVLTDCHGIGRGKTIRRHELKSLYQFGRGIPASIFAQDVAGDDVADALGADSSGDHLCWPIAGTLGLLPAAGRGQVLISMYAPDGTPNPAEPRHALARQIARAKDQGMTPMGAFELEFYLVQRGDDGKMQPARYPLTNRRSSNTNTMSVDELDEMSPFFDAVYAGAKEFDLPLEAVISEYAAGQYELTIRYRDLMRAADDVIIAKRLIRTTARRFGMDACFMAKPFGKLAGSGMHLHLSLADPSGANLFADQKNSDLAPLMLNAIGGIRATMGETMAVLAPFANSWRRFAQVTYSPCNDTWGVENRTVALRVPAGAAKARHFEHRVGGVDANPYLVGALTLGAALDGIAAGADPGPALTGQASAQANDLPRTWLDAIDRFDGSDFARRILGDVLHGGFTAIKRAEYLHIAQQVTEVEWSLYGFSV